MEEDSEKFYSDYGITISKGFLELDGNIYRLDHIIKTEEGAYKGKLPTEPNCKKENASLYLSCVLLIPAGGFILLDVIGADEGAVSSYDEFISFYPIEFFTVIGIVLFLYAVNGWLKFLKWQTKFYKEYMDSGHPAYKGIPEFKYLDISLSDGSVKRIEPLCTEIDDHERAKIQERVMSEVKKKLFEAMK